jgi:hypothetical protein
VHVAAIELDGRSVPPPEAAAAAVFVPLPPGGSPTSGRRLQLVWSGEPGEPPPAAPDVPAMAVGGEPVPAGPVLWTVLAPTGFIVTPDAAPLPPAAAALYRAAAQVRLAEAARSAGADVARVAAARAASELRRADGALTDAGDLPAGPNGLALSAWRQQLRDALPAGTTVAAVRDVDALPYDDAFARGDPVAWYVAAGDEGPRLTWPAPRSNWPGRLLRTAALCAAGVVGVWWGRRAGTFAWPEQFALVGAAAWVADGGALWLLPIAVGLSSRAWLLAVATAKRWDAAGQPEPDAIRG